MAIRDKIRTNAKPHLEPGEKVQIVFPCQTHSAWLMVATGVLPFIIFNSYKTVAVTNRRILIGDSGSFVTTKFNSVETVPRETRIGPASGLWYKTEALGQRLHIHKRFHDDINRADSLAGFVDTPPPIEEGTPPVPPAPAA